MALPKRCDGYWLWVGGPVPPGSIGITVGRLVCIRRSAARADWFNSLLAHELVHVRQFGELGWSRFAARYFGSYVRFRLRGYSHSQSYVRIPLEVEARVDARPAPTAPRVRAVIDPAASVEAVGSTTR